MQKFELTAFRKKKLRDMLQSLFPEYDLFRIKRNGMISFGYKFYFIPIIKKRIHISELCIDEIPKRIGKNRSVCYMQSVNKTINYILVNHSYNIIDYLYQEYYNIKSSNKVDLLIKDNQLSSSESDSDSITIKTILLSKVKHNLNTKYIIKNLDRICSLSSSHNHHCERITLATA
jgi:hypothetical protein